MKQQTFKGEIDTQEMLNHEALMGRAKLVGTYKGVPIYSHKDAKKNEIVGLKKKIPFTMILEKEEE